MKQINLTKLASTIQAYHNCIKSDNYEWTEKHSDTIDNICSELPHGSGIDGKCEILLNLSTSQKILFFVEFNHLNENGYYDGWTEHTLYVTPTFGGFNINISGKNKNDIKEYLSQLFYDVFTVNESIAV